MPTAVMIAHRVGNANLLEPAPHEDHTDGPQIHYQWNRAVATGPWQPSLGLFPADGSAVAVAWVAPITGTYRLSVAAEMNPVPAGASAAAPLRMTDERGKELWNGAMTSAHPNVSASVTASLQAGAILRLESATGPGLLPDSHPDITRLQADLISVPPVHD